MGVECTNCAKRHEDCVPAVGRGSACGCCKQRKMKCDYVEQLGIEQRRRADEEMERVRQEERRKHRRSMKKLVRRVEELEVGQEEHEKGIAQAQRRVLRLREQQAHHEADLATVIDTVEEANTTAKNVAAEQVRMGAEVRGLDRRLEGQEEERREMREQFTGLMRTQNLLAELLQRGDGLAVVPSGVPAANLGVERESSTSSSRSSGKRKRAMRDDEDGDSEEEE